MPNSYRITIAGETIELTREQARDMLKAAQRGLCKGGPPRKGTDEAHLNTFIATIVRNHPEMEG